MREVNRLFALLGALALLRLYTPRNLLILSVFGLGFAVTNMVVHPYKPSPDPLHPTWEQEIEVFKSQKRYDQALNLVNQQIQKQPNFYLGYQVRASIFSELGNLQAYERDMEIVRSKLAGQIRQQVRQKQQLCNPSSDNTSQVQDIYTQSRKTYTCRLLER